MLTDCDADVFISCMLGGSLLCPDWLDMVPAASVALFNRVGLGRVCLLTRCGAHEDERKTFSNLGRHWHLCPAEQLSVALQTRTYEAVIFLGTSLFNRHPYKTRWDILQQNQVRVHKSVLYELKWIFSPLIKKCTHIPINHHSRRDVLLILSFIFGGYPGHLSLHDITAIFFCSVI